MQYPDMSMTIIAVRTVTTVLYTKRVMLEVGINTSGPPSILVTIVRKSPTFKIIVREYEDMAIKVGDKITADSSSGRQICESGTYASFHLFYTVIFMSHDTIRILY